MCQLSKVPDGLGKCKLLVACSDISQSFQVQEFLEDRIKNCSVNSFNVYKKHGSAIFNFAIKQQLLPHGSINTNISLATEGLGFHLQEILHPVSLGIPSQETTHVQQETGAPSPSSLLPSQNNKQNSKRPHTKHATSSSHKKGKSSHSSTSSSHKTGKSSHSSKREKEKSKHSSPKSFSFPLIESHSMRDDLFNQYLKNSVGFSKPALTAALGSVRPATNKIYNLHFSKFCMYLKNEQRLKDLREVKIKHLADYFLFLDAELQLSYAKIVSIRTALRIPLQLVHSKDLLISPELKLVLKGIKGGKTPIRTAPVVWNLPRVLDYLKSKPFYHLKTLSEEKLLAKTLFLLAMASGKRASELAALGAAPPYCIFPHKDNVILDYLPGFLAKNETLEHLHGSCSLNSLKSITPDREEHELCPVRTLKQYLLKTNSPDRIPQLFRRVGKNAPLPVRAISNSLVNTIRSAYSTTSGVDTLTGQVKGHDVRAVAAALQMRNYPSWKALRTSFGWKTPNVFIMHYCRGESALNKIVNNPPT